MLFNFKFNYDVNFSKKIEIIIIISQNFIVNHRNMICQTDIEIITFVSVVHLNDLAGRFKFDTIYCNSLWIFNLYEVYYIYV